MFPLYWNVNPERYRLRLVACCILMGLISIPLILHVVPPNGIYGFRTPLTRSNPAIWYSANAFSGWALLIAAVIDGVLLWRLPVGITRLRMLALFLLSVLSAVAASFAYLRTIA